MSQKHVNLITKYALLLATFSFAEYILYNYLQDVISELIFGPSQDFMRREGAWLKIISFGFTMAMTLITVLCIAQDKRKLGITTRYVFLATIFYRPVGVFAFLIFALMKDPEQEPLPLDLILPERESTQ